MKTNKQIPLNVLLADDDPDDRFFFTKALSEIPIETHLTTVNNGEELMKYFSDNIKNLPDILFLDLSMPRKTGYECLVEMKADKKLENLPAIMYTTSFTRGIDLEANLISTLSKMGAEDYIRKPADFGELKLVIQETLLKIMAKMRLSEKEDLNK